MEALGLAALLMTLAGVWLQWNRPTRVADIEEALKDGRLLPDEAEQRLRAVSRRATGWVLAGMSLLIFVAVVWVQDH